MGPIFNESCTFSGNIVMDCDVFGLHLNNNSHNSDIPRRNIDRGLIKYSDHYDRFDISLGPSSDHIEWTPWNQHENQKNRKGVRYIQDTEITSAICIYTVRPCPMLEKYLKDNLNGFKCKR
jgi:hypothetical protein